MTDSARPYSETILVVDHEPALRELIRVVLRMNGYRVLEAGSGSAALRLIESFPASIHLLLTDRLRPDMDGQKLVERVRSTYPEMKAVLISERIGASDVDGWAFRTGITFLPKPFNVEDLERTVRETLDGYCPLHDPRESLHREAALSWTLP